jgi:hypothetical protein
MLAPNATESLLEKQNVELMPIRTSSGKFDKHMAVANQNPKFRTPPSGRGARRMTFDGCLGKSRVIVAASGEGLAFLPPSEGFFANNQIPRQSFSPSGHCEENVMIGPVR